MSTLATHGWPRTGTLWQPRHMYREPSPPPGPVPVPYAGPALVVVVVLLLLAFTLGLSWLSARYGGPASAPHHANLAPSPPAPWA